MSSSKRVKREENTGVPSRPTSPRDTDNRRTSLSVSPVENRTAPHTTSSSSGGLAPRLPIRRATASVSPPTLSPTGPGFMPSLGASSASSSSSPTLPLPSVAASSSSSEPILGRGAGSGGMGSRRLAQKKQRELAIKEANAPDPGASHFGIDLSTTVWSAQRQYQAKAGGSDRNERKEAHGEITKGARSHADLSQLLPTGMRQHVESHLSQTTLPVHQADLRVDPGSSSSYSGALFTSSFARERPDPGTTKRSTKAGDGSRKKSARNTEKVTQEPSSPKPHVDDDGPFHRAHASPFDVVGVDSNDVRTVWAPQSGNLIVDKHIESAAIASKKRGDSVTMILRSDTNDRSSVGLLSQATPGSAYTLEAAQYQRRVHGGGASSSSGGGTSSSTTASSSSSTSTSSDTGSGSSASGKLRRGRKR
ncbi:hypothetical protein [Chitiniphilus eburneus]|uniref:Uncharacterized protein n=1 Tax=Chitiniphilus eburneus TaxID=2571148 RepID=A0A4U0PM81_9NEIS|nr:hypothetical protein [Chitiniphilus eburneus]TJZ64044.1 hypothetical protein FAZ21_19450 [Chitiniphilus eburneus]